MGSNSTLVFGARGRNGQYSCLEKVFDIVTGYSWYLSGDVVEVLIGREAVQGIRHFWVEGSTDHWHLCKESLFYGGIVSG